VQRPQLRFLWNHYSIWDALLQSVTINYMDERRMPCAFGWEPTWN